jgi:hypothetical protein
MSALAGTIKVKNEVTSNNYPHDFGVVTGLRWMSI